MRYGSMNFPVKPVVAEIQAVASLGMDYVELAMDPPCGHFSQIKAQQKKIAAALQQHGLGLVCHLPTFVYTAHLTDSIREASVVEVLAALETAAELGAEKAVVHPGYIDGLAVYVLDDALARARDSLDRFVRRAGELGLCLCIENMFPRLGPYVEPDDFEPIFKDFPELKFVLDTGHAHIGDTTGRRITDFIERFGHRLCHLHVSDNLGLSDDHLPVGRGTVPFNAVARAMASSGYNGSITLEIFDDDRNAVVESRRALEVLFD
jgi:sugar phosphate isomerase/epimerase